MRSGKRTLAADASAPRSYQVSPASGRTFRQTDGLSMVPGVPVKGPLAGAQFPPENYVAIPVGQHPLYVSGLDPAVTVMHRGRSPLRSY